MRIRLSGILCVATALALTGVPCQPQPAGQERIQLAKRLELLDKMIHEGKAQAAIPELEMLVKLKPDSVRSWQLLCQAYIDVDVVDSNSKRLTMAKEAAQKALSLKPDAGVVHRLLGHIYAEQGQFDQALSELQLAIKYAPNDMFNYKSRALIYSETKRDKEALADYEKFVSMRGPNERNMKVIELGAMIYTRGGQDAKAIALYDELYQKTHSTTYLVDKAKCFARLGKEKEAIETYSQVIKMTDDNEIACFERGKLEARAGRNQQALDDFTKALRQVHTASIYLERAKLLEKMGQPELAKKDRQSAKEDRLDW